MKWQVKCALDTCKAVVPFQSQLRAVKHAVRPFEEPSAVDAFTVQQGLRQLQWIQDSGRRIAGSVGVEIGTGWQPIIPLLFHLAGARRVVLIDQHPLLSATTFRRALRVVRERAHQVGAVLGASASEIESCLTAIPTGNLKDLLAHCRFHYMAPCDARQLDIPSASVDFVVSRAVFEHIPPAVLEGILRECRRILKPSGTICHFIDNSDHWAHRDKSITYVNFLKFGETAWKWTGIQPQNYQNRLRHSDYGDLLRSAGFVIAREDLTVDSRSLEALQKMTIAPRFRNKQPTDLAGIESYFLAVPAGEGDSSVAKGTAH